MDARARIRFGGVILLSFCLCGAGCVHYSTSADRDASFSPYQAARIGQGSLREFLLERSAVLLKADEVTAAPSGTNANHRTFWIRATSLWRGAAAAIDRRGYFLTAAHCVKEGPVWLVFGSVDKMQAERARVVWRGDVSKSQPDLALLKVSLPVQQVFEWGTELTGGSPVLAVGVTEGRPGVLDRQCMAGKVLKLEGQPASSPPFTRVYHDVPFRPGDSGGPLVGSDGRLLGINYGGRIGLQWWPLSVRPVYWNAERPALDWLRALIEQDAALKF